MSHVDVKLLNWREIAARLATEEDPNRVLDLTNALIRALDKDSNRQL
jgi:hypothetical protein